jgi:hypothetical protein
MITNKTLELFDSNIKNELNININIDMCLTIYNYTSLKYEYKSSNKEILKKSKEQYKDIPEYEGHYQISNLGNIKSLKRNGERIMNPCIDKTKGYLRVNLFKESKRKSLYVHQLMAITFLGHKPNGNKLVVDHMDNDKTNNRLDNLQVISSRENSSKDQWRHNPSSYFVGVSYSSGKKKWESSICVNGISFYLGCFKNESNAGQEYANALEYIDKRSNLIDYPFKTNRRGFNEADINQLTFVFSQ